MEEVRGEKFEEAGDADAEAEGLCILNKLEEGSTPKCSHLCAREYRFSDAPQLLQHTNDVCKDETRDAHYVPQPSLHLQVRLFT